jgi:hypothetical protein
MSYFWGPQQASYMRINGFLQEVQSYLVADLRNLRPSEGERSRILFADALSFDWSSPERTVHDERIRLTPQIFKQAQQVAIGLGDRDEADASAIEFVTKITLMSLPEGRLSEAVRQWSNDDPEWVERIGTSVLNLFRRKWWTRLWQVYSQIPENLESPRSPKSMQLTHEFLQARSRANLTSKGNPLLRRHSHHI